VPSQNIALKTAHRRAAVLASLTLPPLKKALKKRLRSV